MLTNQSDQRFAYLLLIFISLLCLLSAWAFLTYPELDLIVHRWFYTSETGFVMKQYSSIEFARKFVMFLYGIWYAYIVVGIFASTHSDPWKIYKKAAFTTRQWTYLVVCSVLGPLVLTNVILKNNWGRARPRQIEEFGGSMEFGPPILWSDQCETNCSFVSGEASSMFMIFASLAFVLPKHRRLMIWLAIILGMLSGIMRIGLGGHFFSDVIFAGLFMFLIAAIAFVFMFMLPGRNKVQIND